MRPEYARPVYALTLAGGAGGVAPVAAATAATVRTRFVTCLLKLLPLLRGQDLTQALVGLSSYLCEARLRLFAQRLKLRARVAEYLLHLRLLLGAQLEFVTHTLEAIRLTLLRAFANPSAIRGRRERARREPEEEDGDRRRSHEPSVSLQLVHDCLLPRRADYLLLAASSSDS
jgi:hypothetical protein